MSRAIHPRVLLALIACGTVLPAAQPTSAAAQDWQTMSSSRNFSSQRALAVDLEYGAGRLNIGAGSDAVLYRADLRYDADTFKPRLTYADNALRVGISDGSVKGRKNIKEGRLDLKLGTRVPLDLELKFGAAEATLDLSGMMVRSAVIQTGASQTMLRIARPNAIVCNTLKVDVGAAKFEAVGLGNLNLNNLELSGGVGEVILDFSGSVNRNMTADIDMGLGTLTLRVPRGTGLMVKKEGILASFDSQGMVKRGDAFYSENWSSARRQVTVNLNASFGSIAVEWI